MTLTVVEWFNAQWGDFYDIQVVVASDFVVYSIVLLFFLGIRFKLVFPGAAFGTYPVIG
ncbi:hypothetical protein KAS45_07345 [candidate division WOR-3 bacterium]|nr:hypothetical protein [candidate division WOR-3 bacterium]